MEKIINQIFTEQTDFILLNEKVSTTLENARSINIDYKTFSSQSHNHWYIYNEEYYYFKELNAKDILSYLLCEKIANVYFHLPTVHFCLAKVGNQFGLCSSNFRAFFDSYFYANYDYFPFASPMETFSYLKQFFQEDAFYNKTIFEILRLVSFHIYSGLRDLIPANILFKKESNGFSLASLYDFDYAFENGIIQTYFYKSALFRLQIPSSFFHDFLASYPEFKECLQVILEIDMHKHLQEIACENRLYVNELYFSYFEKQDQIKKDFIRSLKL